MGNKWLDSAAVIHPADNPYRDILPVSAGQPFEYSPSVSGMHIDIRRCDFVHPVDQHEKYASLYVPLLPALTNIPPESVSVIDRTREVIQLLFQDNELNLPAKLEQFPDANLLILDHGRLWGMHPVDELREALRAHVTAIAPGISAFGRGKRIAQHGLVLSRHGEPFPSTFDERDSSLWGTVRARFRGLFS